MLRIESYVTPIILSYVDKYIKNLKPEDSKVSLWGGDAVFNNLDLRLDVLEQELSSPFTFISGHIHELCIHVPWTKLTSESIVITINTIECILKLKDADEGSDTSSQSGSSSARNQDFRKRSRLTDFDVPASYMQGLMNRIINNVCIVCNNLILKYVEDDIVLSINAKTAEYRSVDKNWIACFQDLTPEELVLRNLVSLTDLTVCLDKRNASGKIDSYQEPLLYRCSFNCRIERIFPTAHSHQPSLTRCDCFCPQLHFSLSDSQLPMFWRLLQLLYALYYDQLPNNLPSDKAEGSILGDGTEAGSDGIKEHQSWSSWAWNVGTSILPVYWEEESEEDSSLQFRKDKILHFGIFVELVTWSFKLTEQTTDSHYSGTTKTKFIPFLTCQHQGSYFTAVASSFEAVNVQCGISCITVDPHLYCICGLDDSELRKVDDSSQIGKFVRCGENRNSYLEMSFFEEDNEMRSWNYNYDWDDHKNTVTESSLLEKTPAFGADYIYILEINRAEMEPELFAEIQTNLEHSNLKERSANRIIIGPSEVHINSGFVHRLYAIKCALDAYEYSPYASDSLDLKPPELIAPPEEEVAALETFTPLRTLSAVCLESSIILHFAQHPQVDIRTILASKNRKKNQKASCELSLSRILPVPGIIMKLSKLEILLTKPFYPSRLVRTACRMRNPSNEMFNNCNFSCAAKVLNAAFYLQSSTGAMVSLTSSLACSLNRKTLLLPNWWMKSSMTKDETVFESDRSSVSFSIPQMKLISLILSSWNNVLPNPEVLYTNSLCHDAIEGSNKFIILMVKLTGIDMKHCKTSSLWGIKVLLSRFSISLCQPNQETLCMLASGPEKPAGLEDFSQNLSDIGEKLAKFSLQVPIDATNPSSHYLLTVATQKFAVIIDPIIFQWLKYSPKLLTLSVANSFVFRKICEVRATPKLPRKSTDSDSVKPDSSSITLSETKTSSYFPFKLADLQTDSSPKSRNWKNILVSIYPIVSNLLISVDIQPVCLFMSVSTLKISSSSGIIDAVFRTYLPKADRSSCIGDALALNLPHFQLKNSSQKVALLENEEFPIIFSPDIVIADKDRLPWSLSVTQCQSYSLQNSATDVRLCILKPSSASATLSLTPKFKEEILTHLGLVIHVDMSPLDFRLSQRQTDVIVTVTNNFLKMVAPSVENKNSALNCSPSVNSSGDKTMAATPQSSFIANQPQRDGIHKSSEGRKRDSIPASAQKLTESTSVQKMDVEPKTVEEEKKVSVTTWIQWTLAKISVSLYSLEDNRIKKLKAVLEDLTLSVDAQYIYCKVVAKVANINVMHYEKSGCGWSPGSYDGVILSTGNHFSPDLKVIRGESEENSGGKAVSLSATKTGDTTKSHGFMSVTMTLAQSANVYGRWNQVVKKNLGEEWFVMENQKPSVLCEIDSHTSAFDLVLHFPVLQAFADIGKPFLGLQISKNLNKKTKKSDFRPPISMKINSGSLPLVYFQAETVRVFLPVEVSNSDEHDLLFAQIESFTIAPQVENPLPRLTIREDLYNAAELAHILGVPGSNLEDRQYQLDLIGLSLSTGAWKDVTKVNNARPRSSSAELLGVRGENPALEWNNYDPNAPRVVNPIFIPLIAKFNTRVILAPAIIYKNQDFRSIVVAGHSVELNVTSDFHIYASMEQLLFLQAYSYEIFRVWKEILYYGSLLNDSRTSDVLDSGVDCDVSSADVLKADNCALFRIGEESTFASKDSCMDSHSHDFNDKFVPFDVLVTGSKIMVDLYEKKVVHSHKASNRSHHKSKLDSKARSREKKAVVEEADSTESEKSPSKVISNIFETIEVEGSHTSDKEAGYEASEEESVCEGRYHDWKQRLLPILHISISQPHAFLSCHSEKQQLDLSYFDLRLKSVPVGYSITDENRLPREEDCFILWLETRPGDPDIKTGVPPAFFTASAHNFLLNSGRLEVKIGRPVKSVISDAKLEQFKRLFSKIKLFIPEDTSAESKSKPKCKDSNIFERYLKLLNTHFHGISHIYMSTSQMVLTLEVNKSKKSELHFSLEGSEFTFKRARKHRERKNPNPEVVSNILCNGIQLKTNYKSLSLRSLVKPFTFETNVRIIWTKWRPSPYIKVVTNLNILNLCIGPENIFALIDCFKYFEHLFSIEFESVKNKQFDKEAESPKISFNDDLRAGMFQFVSQSEFPQPYQVVFDKSSGHMTWCYPEPRSLLKVEIYPVPFVSAVDSYSENSVICVLQYYDEMTDSFVNYKHFKLSESCFCHLDLPGANEKRLIAVSNLWRVCMDDANYTSDCTVSPQALAACMRVDSLFSVTNLPSTKITVAMSKIVINLVNHLTLTGTKSLPSLEGYHLESNYPDSQPFFRLSLSNSRIKALLWEANQYADMTGNCCASIVNYKYLTLYTLLEIPNFFASISVHNEDLKKKPGSIDVQARFSSLNINVSQSCFHTFVVSERCWKQAMQIVKNVNSGMERSVRSKLPHVFLASYVICNDTLHSIVVSQAGTNEVILIKPGHYISYSWRSQLTPPRLKISSREWRSKINMSLDKGSTQVVPMQKTKGKGVSCSAVIVSTKKLSENQFIIKISGMVVVVNNLDKELQFALLDRNHKEDWHTVCDGVASPKCLPLSFIGLPAAIKVRYSAVHSSWSTEIPINLELSKDCFPVKLTCGKWKIQDSSFVLCKIVRRRLLASWRILVTFSPQFVVRSHLPRPMTLILDNCNVQTKQNINIKGRGKLQPINLDSSHLHHISFQLGPTLEESKPPIKITRTMLEQIRTNDYKETGNTEEYLENFAKVDESQWPYVDPFYSTADFLYADQPEIDLQITFSPLYPLCDTVVMDVRPWALIVNHTNVDIILKEGNLLEEMDNKWYINPGGVFAPNKLDGTFIFGIMDGEVPTFSSPLQLHKEDNWYSLSFEGKLPQNGSTNINIEMSNTVCYLTIMSRFENSMQILHLVPTYSIANKTSIPFEVRPMTVRGTRRGVMELVNSISYSAKRTQTGAELMDFPLLSWNIISSSESVGEEGNYLYLYSKSLNANPISIKKPIAACRIAFTAFNSAENCPIANEAFLLTVHPHGSLVKFIIQKDSAPQLLIYNLTAFSLLIAQGCLSDDLVMEEEKDPIVGLTCVPSGKKIYYSLPHFSSNFPNISADGNNLPKLHLSTGNSAANDNRKDTMWSHGIDINQKYDHFIVVPRLGDVKVRTQKLGHTTHVFIDTASRVEISAKDIRSRILVTNKNISISQDIQPHLDCVTPNISLDGLFSPASKKKVNCYVIFVIQELSISVQDDMTKESNIVEVIRLTVDNFVINFRPKMGSVDKMRSLNFSNNNLFELVAFVENIQVDNQLYPTAKYDFPVILIGQKGENPRSKILDTDCLLAFIQSMFNNSLFSCTVLMEIADNKHFIQSVNISCEPFMIYVEYYLVYSLSKFFKAFQLPMASHYIAAEDEDSLCATWFKVPYNVIMQSNVLSNPIFISNLHIDQISFLISVHASAKVYIALDRTPLSFGPYARKDIVTTGYALGYNMTMHYVSSAIFRAGWVVSSLNLLGNPGGFARTVGSGIKDFVQLPYEGILLGPWAFMAGVTNGSLSLIKHLTAGTLLSVTNLANSVARNMERLAMDEEHSIRNETNRRRLKQQGLSKELLLGLSAFGISLLGAIGGIVHQPMHSLMNDGVSTRSLVTGVSKGLVGVVAKPIGGAADLLMHTSQGLLQGAGWDNEHEPRSEPSVDDIKHLLNSDVKYLWKFALKGNLLCVIDATVIAVDSIMSPVTILIDSENIHIICTKTDRVAYESFDFMKVSLRPSQFDPTLVVLEEMEQKEIPADSECAPVCPERIAEYVRSACSEGVDIGNVSSEESLAAETEDTNRKVKLTLSPNYREYLVSIVELCSRRAKGQGFEC